MQNLFSARGNGTGICLMSDIQCSDGTCVPRQFRCNGRKDCPGGEDEPPECRFPSCTELRCKLSGQCIPLGWKCDGESDCPSTEEGPDNTDEDPQECKFFVIKNVKYHLSQQRNGSYCSTK